MFYSAKKKEALKQLEKAQRQYELAGAQANEAVQALYNSRKEAIVAIEVAGAILKRLPDFGIDNIRKIADAKSSIRLFQDAVQKEEIDLEKATQSINDPTGKYVGVAGVGAAAGAAVATLGPAATMAFATTFGTAATGTAISALSGVAATNAALAWLGGGALAAGGGGMAAGSAILAMFGPVGWALGGISAGATGISLAFKNNKIAKQAKEMTEEIQKVIKDIKKLIRDIDKTRERIIGQAANLRLLTDRGPLSQDYKIIVDTILSLCTLINKEFLIKPS